MDILMLRQGVALSNEGSPICLFEQENHSDSKIPNNALLGERKL